ncbi:MAG: hypothetical protein ACK4GG_14045, partial [Sphingomonas sp.]
SDMEVTDGDLSRVSSGLSWLLATIDYLMGSTNLALVKHTERLSDIVNRLVAGEPEAIADYNEALRQLSDDAEN